MSEDSAISITGVGALSTLGTNFQEISASLLAGKTGIREAIGFDIKQHPCQIAGQITLPPCPAQLDPASYDAMYPLEQCVLWCCVQALQDAGLWAERSSLRIGLVLGIAAEWILYWDVDSRRGGRLIADADAVREATVDCAQRVLGLTGPALSVAAACASGNHALAHAKEWLEMGWVDVCVAGACDVGVTPYSMAAFGNLRALSRRNDAPAAALRPFDCDRDGMVLGEGGAVFVLEPAARAKARGRKAYAEVAGVGITSDAYHLVIPNPDATQAIAAMREGLAAARIDPSQIDYVNAHATGTPVGDICEARIIQTVLGPETPRVPVSSTKSMTGHLLAAAAAVEALACLTAMTYGAIPPTVNLNRVDPDCQLCHVPNEAREQKVRVAVSNSFGFGGHNTSLVLKAAG
jgi:3-oxoacyl-[acyl-carrier-protein] synthase II